MEKSSLPKSLRKYLRTQKALIRKRVFDIQKQEEEIKKLSESLQIKK